MRARTRVRACVHFHRRARRNCKVAYMQGVKLRGRSFDPRGSRGRPADPRERIEISIRCNSEFLRASRCCAGRLGPAFPMSIVQERLRHRRVRSQGTSAFLSMKFDERPYHCHRPSRQSGTQRKALRALPCAKIRLEIPVLIHAKIFLCLDRFNFLNFY